MGNFVLLILTVLYLFGVYFAIQLAIGINGSFSILNLLEALTWPLMLAAIVLLILSFEMKTAWRNRTSFKTILNRR